MQPIKPPPTLKVYQLLKQSGTTLSPVGSSSTGSVFLGLGFYRDLNEAEHNRTMETLRSTDIDSFVRYHIYELEIPNPAYQQ